MKESIVHFGERLRLVGVISEAVSIHVEHELPAVIFINPGVIHRVGPNRWHVILARELAMNGYTTLRFDFLGYGDSEASEAVISNGQRRREDVREAMDYLQKEKRISNFILLGFCSGATDAFDVANIDFRVIRCILINGHFLEADEWSRMSPIASRNFWKRNLQSRRFNRNSWRRVVRYQEDLLNFMTALPRVIKGIKIQKKSFPYELEGEAKLRSLVERGIKIFIIYSEWSDMLDLFKLTLQQRIRDITRSGDIKIKIVSQIDHIFTLLWSQKYLSDIIKDWLELK